ncbi:MAG TPA: M20/M25/M40 family metallo-hydrolase [Candidatus Sulfotelmatobacter sp.]|nr:M20/M25/M40 family metallo-hydrolase [Candidatus Sulfotelmatobacter sp.]
MMARFRRRAVGYALVILVVGASAVSSAQITPDVKDTAKSLAGSVYTGPSMETLREFTDQFGGRLSGSPAHNRAVDWVIAKFHSYGIQNVKTESFTIPNGWQRGSAHGELISPMSRPLHVESLGWAPSTPPGGVKGDIVLIDDLSADAIKSKADKIKGKIVMLDNEKIFEDGFWKVFPALEASAQRFKDVGALAVLNPDGASNNVINAFNLDWGAHESPLPEVHLGMEDSKLIRRELEKGPVTIHLEIHNVTSGPIPVKNVIAEIPGSEKPEEWILIGAHFDSWDFGTGAQDNGTGSASVLEIARAIAALGKPPKRTVRFALWGGEEEGLLGSYAYVQAHLNEMGKCVAVLNTDNGSGHPKGWKVEGRKDVKEALQLISDSVLKDIGGGGVSMEITYDTDHGPFMLQGVPVFDLWLEMKQYEEVHHKSSDTFDKVDPVDFKSGEAIVAATAWIVANAEKPIAGHIDHAAVAEILKKNEGLAEVLTAVGQWKP